MRTITKLIPAAVAALMVISMTSVFASAEGDGEWDGEIIFEKDTGEDIMNTLAGVTAVPGGYIAVGSSIDLNDWTSTAFIVKFNNDGELAWESTFDDDDCELTGVTAVSGGAVAVGRMAANAWIMKLATNGSIEWKKEYTGAEERYLFADVAAVGDGVVAVGSAGNTAVCGAIVVRYDAAGNVEWDKDIGDDKNYRLDAVGVISDRIFAAGTHWAFVGPDTGSFLVKLDDNDDGRIIWKKESDRTGLFSGIAEVSGGIIITAADKSEGYDKAALLKFDHDGILVWEEGLGDDRESVFYGMTIVSDGIIAVGTYKTDRSDPIMFPVIVKYKNDGTLEWENTFDIGIAGVFRGIAVSPAGIVVVGMSVDESFSISAAAMLFPGDDTGTTVIPVSGITGIPSTATVGTLTLNGTVAPADATNKTITWAVKSAGTTGASVAGNVLTTTAAGTVTVTATVAGGTDAGTAYTQDFTITVSGSQGPKTGDGDGDNGISVLIVALIAVAAIAVIAAVLLVRRG